MSASIYRASLILAVCTANQSLAGGLWLNEYGDFAGGRATAGASAGTDEASTIVHNPASAGRNENSQLFASVGAYFPTIKFDIENTDPLLGNGDGGQAGQAIPGAAFAYIQDMDSSKWGLGISLAGMAGAGLKYQQDWVGRYQDTEIELSLLRLAPAVSYNITEQFAVGIAPQFYYASLMQKLHLPAGLIPEQDEGRVKIDGNDTGVAYMTGATYDFSPTTRVGLSYQSEIKINFDGHLEISPIGTDINSDTELTMAGYVRAGLHHDLNDKLGLDLTVGWDNWSALNNIFVSTSALGSTDLVTNWEDTYHYAAGFQYKLDSDWDLTAGIAYDTNPVKSRDRTPELPVDRQIRYNMGVRYAYSKSLTLGGYLNYTDLGDARINADYSGKYSSNEVASFAAFLNWRL